VEGKREVLNDWGGELQEGDFLKKKTKPQKE
jgi:hypothetical protein